MKTVTRYRTYDDQIHNDKRSADKHLNKKYGDIILEISRSLIHQNHTKIIEYIDNNLFLFIELDKIKKDFEMDIEDTD